MSSGRYVAKGVPGGYRIWNTKEQDWWGDLYDFCPDELLKELNGKRRPAKLTELTRKYRAMKR